MKSEIKKPVPTAVQLDEKTFELDCAIANLIAVHDAMEAEKVAPHQYVDALFGTYIMLKSVSKDMNKLVEDYFREVKGHE